MSIKLIATDLDGTLMAPDHLTVTPRTVNALKKASEKGIKIAIATGRPMAIITDVIAQVDFVDYVIYANGACVYDLKNKKNIYENPIPQDDANEVIKALLGYPVFFEVYIDGIAYYQTGTEQYFKANGIPQDFLDSVMTSMVGYDDLYEFVKTRAIQKITMYSVSEELVPIISNLLEEHNMNSASSLSENLETTVKGADKGEALKQICSILKINADECMAFGDAGNDCEMLEFAAYSFAMANGSSDCKAAAKYQARSNADDGLAIAVETFALDNSEK